MTKSDGTWKEDHRYPTLQPGEDTTFFMYSPTQHRKYGRAGLSIPAFKGPDGKDVFFTETNGTGRPSAEDGKVVGEFPKNALPEVEHPTQVINPGEIVMCEPSYTDRLAQERQFAGHWKGQWR